MNRTPNAVANPALTLWLQFLGIKVDENALANELSHDWRSHETYHLDDGSVVNT